MYLVVIAWIYVVLMMALVEALSSQGTVTVHTASLDNSNKGTVAANGKLARYASPTEMR